MGKTVRRFLFGQFQTHRITPIDWGLLALRVGFGALMIFGHGWGKLAHFGDYAAKFADPLRVGVTTSLALTVFAEFFCSLAVALGLFTRLAAMPLIVTMLVAAFVINADAPWGDKELAVLYLVPYITLLFAGPGRISLDRKLSR